LGGSPPTYRNPVLSYRDVSDVDASFVADPFMIREQGTWYMFFEVKNRTTGQGEIGLAESEDGLRWRYRQIVLREPFHLSYPDVFKWEGEYYMIPETLALNGIHLYRAVRFPTDWRRVATLVQGSCADPSIVRFDGRWWMFACTTPYQHDTLRLYHAPELTGPWREHPQSPLIEGNNRLARPAGRVTPWQGRLLRFAQDCGLRYGASVRALAINELTPAGFREEEVKESPILSAGDEGWNRTGMHHIDPQRTAHGTWIACVDGHAV
jgi:hypothetical protein